MAEFKFLPEMYNFNSETSVNLINILFDSEFLHVHVIL